MARGTGEKQLRTISGPQIAARIQEILDPGGTNPITHDEPITNRIHGAGGAVSAFYQVLNGSPQFKPYRLALVPHDMNGVKLVRHLIQVVRAGLQRQGVVVTI